MGEAAVRAVPPADKMLEADHKAMTRARQVLRDALKSIARQQLLRVEGQIEASINLLSEALNDDR